MNTAIEYSDQIEGLKILSQENLIPMIATKLQPNQKYEITEVHTRKFPGNFKCTRKLKWNETTRWKGNTSEITVAANRRSDEQKRRVYKKLGITLRNEKYNTHIHKEPKGLWLEIRYPLAMINNEITLIKQSAIDEYLQKGFYYVETNPDIPTIEPFLIPKKEWTNELEEQIKLHAALAFLKHNAVSIDIEKAQEKLSFQERMNTIRKDRAPNGMEK